MQHSLLKQCRWLVTNIQMTIFAPDRAEEPEAAGKVLSCDMKHMT